MLRSLWRAPIFVALLGPTLVLSAYSTTQASPFQLLRPLATSAIGTLLLFSFLCLLTRRPFGSGAVTALFLLAVAGLPRLLTALAVALLFVAVRNRVWQPRDTPSEVLLQPLNAIAIVWFVIASGMAVVASWPPGDLEHEPVTVGPGPNVYLVLLDAYPRRDSLIDYFDFDNGPFLRDLEDRGFDVAENSTSPYVGTIQVVPTMFQMRPMEELLNGEDWDPLDITDAQHRRLWHALNGAPIVDAFEAAGYRTISIPSSAEDLDLRSADSVLQSAMPTRFEDHLLSSGVLGWFLDFDSMDRAELLDEFRLLELSAGQSPRFVFAHFMTPHNPYVFRADGTPAEPCGDPCRNHAGPPNAMLADRLLGQLQWTNSRLLEALDHIIAVDPEATVIVFSDHGLRRDLADMDEWHRTLFATRNAAFPDDVTPMMIFSALIADHQ